MKRFGSARCFGKLAFGHVHCTLPGSAARTAFWLKRLFGVEYSITAHANDIFRDDPRERLDQIFRSATAVITVSEFSLAYLREKFPFRAREVSSRI